MTQLVPSGRVARIVQLPAGLRAGGDRTFAVPVFERGRRRHGEGGDGEGERSAGHRDLLARAPGRFHRLDHVTPPR
jgi:hypothetical protein